MSYCSYDKNSFLHYIDENKLFSFLTSFTFAVVGIFIYILRTYTFFEKRRIPRAVRPTAPFGNIKDVLFQNSTLYVYLWKYYNRFKRKGFRYGGLYLFLKPGVLIVDPALTVKILSEGKCLTDVYKRKCIKDYKLIVRLFNNETLDIFLKSSNVSHCISSTADINEKCVTTVLHNFFMETTCSAFGFKNSLEIFHTVNTLLKDKTCSSFLHYFYLFYPLFKLRKPNSELQDYLKSTMELRKKNDVRENDITQGVIDLINAGIYDVEESAQELFEIFADNIIHSYSAVLFCLYELATNGDVQQEVIGEIRRFRKEKKQINLTNLQQLVYLDMVVKETLRKYPPIPVVIKRCEEGYKVTDFDFDFPRGTFTFVSIFGIHHDPEIYPDPEKFNPERFSEENAKFIKSNTYIPFGLSSMKHIGLHFTTIHIKLGLLSILSFFKVNLSGNHPMTFDNKKLPVCPEEPIPLKFESL